MQTLLKGSFLIDNADEDEQTAVVPSVSDISGVRLNANRENAKHSTGAKTPEGKAVVAQNSVTHGLTGRFHVLANEVQSEFDELLTGLLTSHAPADAAEIELVTSTAESLWLARRANRLQNRCLESIEYGDADAAKAARLDLNLYLRYQTTHERSYQRYAAELRKLQSEKRKVEIGFASQKRQDAEEQRKQEKHEATVANIKARTEQQQMKNYPLSRAVKMQKETDARNERWEAYTKARDAARSESRKRPSKRQAEPTEAQQ
jgi:hypothetical protein